MAAELDFCEGTELYKKDLPGMVADGRITMAQLEKAAGHILRAKILSGMIDGQPPASEAGPRDSPAHRALVYESGLKSIGPPQERGWHPAPSAPSQIGGHHRPQCGESPAGWP